MLKLVFAGVHPSHRESSLWLDINFDKERKGEALYYLSWVMIKLRFAYGKTKAQISCAVVAQLISAFDFATSVEEPCYFLIPQFQAFSHFL